MEESSIDENVIIENNETIEICMNDVVMEVNVSVQIETNKNLKNKKEEQMKINL
jgi:hypothetical protein